MKTVALVLAAVGCLAVALAGAARANPLVDPAFEGLSPTGTQYPPTYLGGHTDGWYVTGPTGAYLYWDWGGIRGQYQHLNSGATIQQAFPTSPGALYTVSFEAVASEAVVDASKYVRVLMDDGNVVAGAYDGDLKTYYTYETRLLDGNYFPGITEPWYVYSFVFTAGSAQTTISVSGYSRVAVDTFDVVPMAGPVPEPAALGLIGVALLALRRRRS